MTLDQGMGGVVHVGNRFRRLGLVGPGFIVRKAARAAARNRSGSTMTTSRRVRTLTVMPAVGGSSLTPAG